MLLSVVVLLIIFLVNKDKIFTNLKETNFFEKIFGTTPAVIENHQVKKDESEEMPLREDFNSSGFQDSSDFPELKSGLSDVSSGSVVSGVSIDEGSVKNLDNNVAENGVFSGEFGVPGTFGENPGSNNVMTGDTFVNDGTYIGKLDSTSSDVLGNNNTSATSEIADANGSLISGSATVNSSGSLVGAGNNVIIKDVAPKTIAATSTFDLCFVMIDGDGAVLRKMIKRTVPKSDSPLTTAINLLLEGPDVRNKPEAECRSLIPEGSKLLSARVADGIAYLNFNEEFEFNPFGVEGAIHQLEQIVYTATAFSTVNSVQFLIEGQKQEYLGSEGQWIGTPLSRASF